LTLLEETPRDFLIRRVEPQREVRRQHDRRMTLGLVVRSGTRFAPAPFAGIHWVAPPGLLVCTHSKENMLMMHLGPNGMAPCRVPRFHAGF
jgi:hypothetical protein